MAMIYGWILFYSTFRCHLCTASSGVVSLAVALDRLFIWLPERPLFKMQYTDGSETSSRRELSHRPQPSSPNNRVLQIACRENLNQFFDCIFDLWINKWKKPFKLFHIVHIFCNVSIWLEIRRVIISVWKFFINKLHKLFIANNDPLENSVSLC